MSNKLRIVVSSATIVLLSTTLAFAQTDTTASAVVASIPRDTNRTDLKGVLMDSFKLLLVEHTARIALQEKTRRELGGPFFADYARSVRVPGQWGDGDKFLTNYVGHPIQGAASAFIWIAHSPESRQQAFGFNADYFHSRIRPVLASAVYSLQFEIGPLSEASIGNVGTRPETTGWVDYVVTPLGALGFMVGEDALDRVLAQIEERVHNRLVRVMLRLTFGPSRAMSNFSMGRSPWYREGRPLNWK